MGLDMNLVLKTKTEKTNITYWRKHHDLHGFLNKEWIKENPNCSDEDFNCIEFYLTIDILERAIQGIKNNSLPHTTGFFFGNQSGKDDYYNPDDWGGEKNAKDGKDEDIKLLNKAIEEIKQGNQVFYTCSW